MKIKNTKKRDGRIEPFDISKIQKQLDFAVEGTGLSAIEYESILNLPNKETIETKVIQETIINSGKNKISIENTKWDKAVGRADMYQLYRSVHKLTKFEVTDWIEHIKYLVRNGYYRKDILGYLNNLIEQDSKDNKFIKTINKYIETKNNYDWKMSYAQVEMLKSKYLIKNKKGIIEYPILSDIVNALILTSKNIERFTKMFEMIHLQYISLATPFKRNLRRPNGNTGSCYIGEAPDNLAGIMKSNTDMAHISKEGGGIGWYLGKIRPENSYSYNIVKSNNITKWVKIINDIAVAVNQAGVRLGAITVALDWWHLDIYSFLDVKSELKGDLRDKAFDIFPQVVVDQYFMNAVREDKEVYLFNQYEYKKLTGIDVTEQIEHNLEKIHLHIEELVKQNKFKHAVKIRAKDLWKRMLWVWIEIGDFYIANKDKINFSNYLKYDEEGGISKCVNLCLTGDTKVEVKINNENKIVSLKELEPYIKDNDTKIYIKSYDIETNEIQYQECYEFLDMGEAEELYEIEDELGNKILCTSDHKIYTKNRGYVEAKDLVETDILISTKTSRGLYDGL